MPATYEPIATTTLGSAASSVTFSSISGSYTDLILVCVARSATASISDTYLMTFNGLTTNIYSRTRLLGSGSAVSSARRTSAPNIDFEGLAGNTSASGTFMMSNVQIQNYSNSTTYKTSIIRQDDANNYVVASVGLFSSTAAITSIGLATSSGANFQSGSTFTLYGIKSA
jgi:hypothetical protein